jgi:hypothetical protein
MKPISFDVPMTVEQYTALHAKLPFSDTASSSGHLVTKDVGLDWIYNPGTLTVRVTDCFSFKAKMASADQIESKIKELLTA